MLERRAALLADVRRYFADEGVLEVETPNLTPAAVTDPAIGSFEIDTGWPLERRFLTTSPEYHMKRLLAAGSGSIYQIARAFRRDEAGRHHHPEFTLLEWYRVGFTMDRLMADVSRLVEKVTGFRPAERVTYEAAFVEHTGIDPHTAGDAELLALARAAGGGIAIAEDDRALALDLLFAHLVTPNLGRRRPVFVTHYPAVQAALARLTEDPVPQALRFELFIDGMEIANGFEELTDAREQRRRFVADNALRRRRGLPAVALDDALLAALAHGLPDCAGVALGVDRLLLAMTGAPALRDVLSFCEEGRHPAD